MSAIALWLKVGIVCMVVLSGGQALAAARPSSGESPAQTLCAAPEYRQFDFWAGDWDVFDVGSPVKVARARVDLILDGCVLREDYQGTDGLRGQSFTTYDMASKVWRQSWVTNRGQLLVIEGVIHNGEMVLSGADRTTNGQERQVQGTWKPVDGGMRETAVTSTDGEKTWKPWFDLVFRPHDAAAADDQKIVAALDTQYQAAVKQNDAATMDLILADDFVLVTGTGKTYSKADLLAEARSGRVHYERQDDTDQTVRIWGDTAVVTAKLFEKGTDNGKPFDYTVWFSDTYVRTPAGWRYVFGQASLPLPTTPNG